MDSFFVKALGLELKSKIVGARVGRPWLEEPFQIILPLTLSPSEGRADRHTRAPGDRPLPSPSGGRVYLYCSCNPAFPILYLTSKRPGASSKEEKRLELPGRKHHDQTGALFPKYLTGALIAEIRVVDMERILIFRLQGGSLRQQDFAEDDYSCLDLVFELMGRNANVILTTDQGKILAALRSVPAHKNRYRQILPGHIYCFPPKPAKEDPLSLTEESFLRLLETYDGAIPWPNFLHQKIAGLDLLLAGEIVARAESKATTGLSLEKAFWIAFLEIMDIYRQGSFSPAILYPEDGTGRLISFPLRQQIKRRLPDQVFSTASEAARQLEKIWHQMSAVQTLRSYLEQKVHLALDKARARHLALEDDLCRAEQAEQYRKQADLIMAYAHQLRKGMDQLNARDLFDPQSEAFITIPLDPRLTPIQNAQSYYKKYTKAKRSKDIVRQRLEEAQRELTSLSLWLSRLEAEESLGALLEYADTLREEGIIQPDELTPQADCGPRASSARLPFKDIRRYVSVDGLEILVGKNDRGNDTLINKIARKDDLWLHAQDAAGSHVLVRNPQRLSQIPYSTILQAASLAAYFSKARNDTKVAVAYAFKKYVTKPKGAKPGLVVMSQKTTILVSPEIKNFP